MAFESFWTGKEKWGQDCVGSFSGVLGVTEIGLGMQQRFLVCRKVFRALKGFKKDKKDKKF